MGPDYGQSYFIGFVLEAVLWGSYLAQLSSLPED
jgi:hypothetical protein